MTALVTGGGEERTRGRGRKAIKAQRRGAAAAICPAFRRGRAETQCSSPTPVDQFPAELGSPSYAGGRPNQIPIEAGISESLTSLYSITHGGAPRSSEFAAALEHPPFRPLSPLSPDRSAHYRRPPPLLMRRAILTLGHHRVSRCNRIVFCAFVLFFFSSRKWRHLQNGQRNGDVTSLVTGCHGLELREEQSNANTHVRKLKFEL